MRRAALEIVLVLGLFGVGMLGASVVAVKLTHPRTCGVVTVAGKAERGPGIGNRARR